MELQASIAQIDVNRALRDRLGRERTAATTVRQASELTMAVNDLQDLARNRLETQPTRSPSRLARR